MLQKTILSAISWLTIAPLSSGSPTGLNMRTAVPTAQSVKTMYQFPNGTWLENLAVRENGGVLLSEFDSPNLLYVNPLALNPNHATIHTFSAPATGIVGIAELGSDIFYVGTIGYSFSTFSAASESGQLWKVDMTNYPTSAPVTHIADIKSSGQLNGVTALPGTTKILLADYTKGVIWRVDVDSGAVDIAANDTALAASGVNGIHAPGNGYLYFTNTGAGSYGRFAIDSTGTQTGAAKILFQNSEVAPDDFALYTTESDTAAVLMDGTGNRIVYTSGTSDSYSVIVDLDGPTAAAFGRRSGDTNTLYISSTGGDLDYAANPVPVGGALTRIIL